MRQTDGAVKHIAVNIDLGPLQTGYNATREAVPSNASAYRDSMLHVFRIQSTFTLEHSCYRMKIAVKFLPESGIACSNCAACCCRLEVMLISDTGVPDVFVEVDKWGGSTMRRLDDGWCAALDRNTMLCSVYEKRPLICREFVMGSDDCVAERQATV